MLLALDARTIYRPNRRGTGKNLVDLYRALIGVRPQWRILALHRQTSSGTNPLPNGSVTPRQIEMIGDRFDAWERVRLPLAAWRAGADVLHCPANTSPGWMPLPTVVTIHDLIPLDMPAGRPLEQVHRFEHAVRTACRHAAAIICPSFYTRSRLIADFGADGSRVVVNPWASDSSVTPLDAEVWRPVAARYGVHRRCVLHFGAADSRKNTAGVIEAWARIPAAQRRTWTLLVVGLDQATYARYAQMVIARDLLASVRLHGFAPEEDLPALLNAADILAFPSLSEGFGLPILDAWVARTAVLTSDRTSLPEVAGDAALLVDPTNTDAIAAGLARLIDDASFRATLVASGAKRLSSFTWDRTAERFASCMEFAAGRSSASIGLTDTCVPDGVKAAA